MKKILILFLLTLTSCSNDDDKFICSENCGKIISVDYVNEQPIVTFKNTCGYYIVDDSPNTNYNLYIGDSYCKQ